jgi:hypothetical protein
MLTTWLKSTIQFFQENHVKILAGIGVILMWYFTYKLTTGSLKKLKPEILTTYPFDLIFPQGGKWSIGYFLLIVIFLAAIVYLLVKGNFYFAPA